MLLGAPAEGRRCSSSRPDRPQVVQLRLGRVDVLVAAVAQPPQVLPAEVVAREVGLRVRDVAAGPRRGRAARARASGRRCPARAARPSRSSTVGKTSTPETWARRRPRDAPRRADDERHARRGVVDEVGRASASPCSPRLSPWSAVTTTSVRSSEPAARAASRAAGRRPGRCRRSRRGTAGSA